MALPSEPAQIPSVANRSAVGGNVGRVGESRLRDEDYPTSVVFLLRQVLRLAAGGTCDLTPFPSTRAVRCPHLTVV
jgi:hypothetical protein